MIDSHCHLNHAQLWLERATVIARARQAGLAGMIVVGYDLPSSEQAVQVAEEHPDVWATVGIHPHDARTYTRDVEARLAALTEHPRVVAVGEIGLDYHYEHSSRDDQRKAFAAQLGLAERVALPVILHCREAHSDVLDELARHALPQRGVMHCWSGTIAEAERTIELGLMLGIGGVLTFKKRGELAEVVRQVPRERLLIETDAPYLAPVPHRGHRNEPAFVQHVCRRLADELGESPENVARLTTDNAVRLFGRLRLPI
jgi:TatD DNase family protein